MNATAPFVLAIDVGTSSTRAMIFDATGRPATKLSAQVRYTVPTRDDGAAEADVDKLFTQVTHCLDELFGELVGATDQSMKIGAVGISTFAGNLVGVDGDNRPVTPLLLYADTRAAEQVAQLRNELDEARLHQRTGCRLHAAYWPAQLRWIAANKPDWLTQTEQWITLGDYFQRRLLATPGVSYSMAAWTGMLNRQTLDWDDELLGVLPIDRGHLGPLTDVTPAAVAKVDARLTPEYATRWPTLRNACWLPAAGDGACANLGSDCATPARVALTVGTTSAMRTVTYDARDSNSGARPRLLEIPDGLWCYRVDGPRALVGGALTEGGNLFAWARRTLKLPQGQARLEAALAQLAPDAHGLTFLPLLGGERAPGWQAHLRGSIQGVSLATTPEEVLRAGLEGIALRISLVYDRLAPLVDEDAGVIASGGALLHSPTWLQIMADVLNRPVQPSPVAEASARGAALLALAALDIQPPPIPLTTAAFIPNPAAHVRYQAAAARQAALYAWVKSEG